LSEVGETRREIASVLELRHRAALEAHGFGHVQDDTEVRVRVRFVLLDVEAIGPREQPPVDAADVVARHVPAMLGEINGRAEVGRAVHPVDEAVDDRSREELEVADPRKNRRVDEPGPGNGRTLLQHVNRLLTAYIPERGVATADSRSSMS